MSSRFRQSGGYEDVGFVADEFQHYGFQLFSPIWP